MKMRVLKLSVILFGISTLLIAQVTPGSIIEEEIDPYISKPAINYCKEIPVVIVRYLPTIDGFNIDVSQVNEYWSLGEYTLDELKSRIDQFNKRVKFSLEEGSRYHGYKDNQAKPFLGYRVVKYITVYRQIKTSTFSLGTEGEKNLYQPDYKQEFDDLNISEFINENNVKEVWFWYGEAARPNWPSYDEQIHGDIDDYVSFVESNMSSHLTGDISNSYRYVDDLYILDHSYVVYCYNFARSQAEAVHNHGHQLESMYKYISTKQDGNHSMFVQNFSGWGDNNYTIPPLGRAGDTHHPPNTTTDYDYLNTTLIESDIEDWNPFGGLTKPVNVDTWGNLIYNWPGESYFSQKTESQWYIYWMQNMPGFNNNITFNSSQMTNWWMFTSNWDSCYNNNIGLYFDDITSRTLSIDENEISIFPNPTKNDLYINGKNISGMQVLVLDLIGNPILITKKISNELKLDLSFLNRGIYLIKIKTNGEILTSKILKN